MRKQILIAVALAALVAMSGCSGLLPGDDPTENEQTADGDFLTPETSPEEASDVDAPGVSSDGVDDIEALLSSHHEQLSHAQFTTDLEMKYTTETDGEIHQVNRTQTGQFDSGTALVFENFDGMELEYWLDHEEDEMWTKTVQGGDESYRYDSSAQDSVWTNEDLLRPGLNAFNFEYVGTSDELDEPLYVFESTEVSDASALEQGLRVQGVEDAEMKFAVNQDGVVHAVSLSVNTSQSDQEFSVTYGNFGDTTVEEPDWLATAHEEAYIVDLSKSDDNSYLVFNYKQGDVLSPDAVELMLAGGANSGTVSTNVTLQPENTYYISINNESVTVHEEEPVGVESDLTEHTYYIAGLHSEDRNLLFQDDTGTDVPE